MADHRIPSLDCSCCRA